MAWLLNAMMANSKGTPVEKAPLEITTNCYCQKLELKLHGNDLHSKEQFNTTNYQTV
jgi:hypothetical protein